MPSRPQRNRPKPSRYGTAAISIAGVVDLGVAVYAATQDAWEVTGVGLVLGTAIGFSLRHRVKRTRVSTPIGEVETDYELEDAEANVPRESPPDRDS
jgi:hypothetical protein